MAMKQRWLAGFSVALALGGVYLQAHALSHLLYAFLLTQVPPLPAPPPEPARSPSPPPIALAPSAVAAPPPTRPAPAPPELRHASDAPPLEPVHPYARVRFAPEVIGGRVRGVRVWAGRDDSILALLGLQNGDRLEAVNGYEFTSSSNLLRAYADLRHESDFELRFQRNGRTIRHIYRVR